jgi:uncharacterized membrane protein
MIFFAFMAVSTLVARFVDAARSRKARGWPQYMRWGMAGALLFFGLDHLLTPDRYIPMVPTIVPHPDLIVAFTGLCEIAGGIGLLLPRVRKLAGIMLALYFVCVFPANVKNALDGLSVDGLPSAQWYYWIRLLFQPLAVWWALFAAEVIRHDPLLPRPPQERPGELNNASS